MDYGHTTSTLSHHVIQICKILSTLEEISKEQESPSRAWGYNTIDLGLPQPNSPVYLLYWISSLPSRLTCTHGRLGLARGSNTLRPSHRLLLLGVQLLLQRHTELFPEGLELLEVLLVLALVLDLGLDTCGKSVTRNLS